MLSTAVSIEFEVYDLSSSYKVVGSSLNYSFEEDLGLGSDLVEIEGAVANKVISLKGNYGKFSIRVFAENTLGIKSNFIEEDVIISPPSFDGTFTFSNLRVSNLPEDSNQGYYINTRPTKELNELIVNSEYINKNIVFNWELIPPEGHYLQGESISSDLLNDNFLSGFKLQFFNDGQLLDFSSMDQNSAGLTALSEQFSTSPANIDNVFSNYRDFSIELNQDAFEGFNLSRNVDLRITAVDSFGAESTGTIKTKNHSPTLFNFVDSFKSSSMNMSWADSDTDYSGVRVRALALPYDQGIFNEKSITDSLEYYSGLSSSKAYDDFNYSKYYVGEKVLYEDGNVYECLESFTRSSDQDDPSRSAGKWKKLENPINFEYVEEVINSYSFSLKQNWGFKYYYDLLPFDQYGSGDLMNLSDQGLSIADDSILKSYKSEIKLSEIQYRENKDSFIFNWEVLDQDNQSVDIDKFRFSLSSFDVPSILGISGSLFDSDTNIFISGITEGNNSKSLSINSDGFTEVSFELPGAKNFNSFQYTRGLNNEIYGTGGFISNYNDYQSGSSYSSGDHVLSKDGKIFELLFEPESEIYPFYENWSNNKSYSIGEKFKYQNNIFNTISSFRENDPKFKGVYNESESYSIGDIVISVNSKIRTFSSGVAYDQGEFIFYQGSIYKALFTNDEAPSPLSDFWQKASPFTDVSCDYYKLLNNSNIKTPHESILNWKKVNPLVLSIDSDYFEVYVPSYQHNVSHWSNEERYVPGDVVLYGNDIWSGMDFSYGQLPDNSPNYWSGNNFGSYSSYYGRNYLSGDLVCSNNYIYKCLTDNPSGGPILAKTNAGQQINSTYNDSSWLPVWEEKIEYNNYIFDHVGIPESGKRNIGIEVGIIDTDGNVVDVKRRVAENPPPVITDNSFKYENITNVKIPDSLDSLTEASKVKFNFNYINGGLREKTTKVNVYRSNAQNFSITGVNGLPYDSLIEEGSTLVKTVVGAADATFGDNINQIIDEPPVPLINGIEEKTGYFYKILPFDDFGSGSLYQIDEKVLVWPRNYSDNNKNALPGPVLSVTSDEIPGPVNNFGGEVSFNTYFLNWDMPLSQSLNNSIINIPPNDLSHYELWFKYINDENEQSLIDQGDADAYFRTGDGEKFSLQDNDGYRRIEGDILSSIGASEDIPVDEIDPGLSIINAINIFDIPASSPSVKVSHVGAAGEKGYFWVRAVDKAGNKGPFVGDPNALQDDLYIPGLNLELGGVDAADLGNFQENITSEFRNTPAIVSERGNNPFVVSGDIIEWVAHTIWLNGGSYSIPSGSATNSSSDLHYVYWNPNTAAGYEVKTSNPSNDQNNSGFVVATWSNGQLQVSYHAFANALIGTAQISNAAITDAKIKSLKADQITAGNGLIADLEITQGLIKSKNFDFNSSGTGFQLNNDGTFIFRGFNNQGGTSSLQLDSNANLILRGKLRQVSGNDFDFIEITSSPSYFKYLDQDGDLILDVNSHNKIFINVYFRNTSVSGVSDVSLTLKYFDSSGGTVEISDSDSNFIDIKNSAQFNSLDNPNDGCIISYEISASQFNSLITQSNFMADSLIFLAKSNLSNIERSISIPRLTEGKIGEDSISIVGSNDNHSLVVNDDGSEVQNLQGANNEIFVYEGVELLTYVDNKNNHEGLSDNGSYNLNVTYSAQSTITATINNQGHVVFSGNSISSSIVFVVTAYIKNKSSQNVERSMSITLSPSKGGVSAKVVKLESTSYVVKYDNNQQNADPGQINLTTEIQGFKNPVYTFRDTYGQIILQKNSDTIDSRLSIEPPAFGQGPRRFSVEVCENHSPNAVLAQDSITIITVKDPQDSISLLATNQNHSIITDKSGNNAQDVSEANGEILVFDGSQKLNFNKEQSNHDLLGKAHYNLSVSPVNKNGIAVNLEKTTDGQNNAVVKFTGDSLTAVSVFTVTAYIKTETYKNETRSTKITLAPAKEGSSARVAKLEADSYVVKYDNNEANPDPSEIIFTINSQGFEDPEYVWKIGSSVILGENDKNLTIGTNHSSWFSFRSSPYLVKAEVVEKHDHTINAADSITIVTLRDGIQGSVGRTPTYRGEWSEYKAYYAVGSAEDQAVRGDVVKYEENNNTADKYFICIKTHNTQKSKVYSQKPVRGINYDTANPTYWAPFGAEFESVATSFLLTEEAYITNSLVIGDGEKTGTIVSNVEKENNDSGIFVGGFDEAGEVKLNQEGELDDTGYSNPGFRIEKGSDFVVFDVGGASSNTEALASYIRYSSAVGKFEIRGASVNNTSREDVIATLNDNDTNYSLNGGADIDDTLATFVGGGYNNDILDPNNENSYQSLASCIIGGGSNNIVGRFSLIGAGFENVCEDNFSAIIAGYGNQMPEGTDDNQGANFIGAGQYNTIQGGTNQTILNGQRNVISNV